MVNMKHHEGFFSVIPHAVLYNFDVSGDAKILYLIVMNLANDKGYCFASNQYLAERTRCSDRTVQRHLSELKDAGYINSVLHLKPNGDLDFRAITPLVSAPEAKSKKPSTSPEDDMGFLEFFQAYPRKINKAKAKEEFMLLSPEHRQLAIDAAKKYAAATNLWSLEDKKYINSPHTWLSGRRFEDDPKEWTRSVGKDTTFKHAGAHNVFNVPTINQISNQEL